MKQFRRLILLAVSIIGLFLLTGLVLSLTYEKVVIKYLKKYLDKHLKTEMEVTQIKLSFIRKFPNATIELKNLVIQSGTGYQKEEFAILNTDTLLSARSAFFEFSLPGVLKNKYKLKNIRIVDGKILLLKDSGNKGNSDIWKGTKGMDNESFTLTLQNIILSGTQIKYLDIPNKIKVYAETKKLFIEADLKKNGNFFSSSGYLFFHQISAGRAFEISGKKLGVDLKIKYHKNQFTFLQSSIHSGKLVLDFSGEIQNEKDTFLKLNFFSNNASLKEIENLYPAGFSAIRKNHALTGGLMNIKGTINGIVSKNVNPKIDLSFDIRNAMVTNQKNRKRITGISVNGNYSNGSGRNKNTSVIDINEFAANQGKSRFEGAVKMKGLNSSNIEITLQSKIQVEDFVTFLNIDTFEYISGTISTNIRLKGYISSLKKIDRLDLVSFKKEGVISCRDLTFKVINKRLTFENLNGNLLLDDIIKLRDCSFIVSKNDIKLDGNLINLPQYLFDNGFLSVDAKIRSQYLDIRSIISDKQSDTIREPLAFPERIILRSSFSVDRLTYGKFLADNIEGSVNYKPKTFHFEYFQLQPADGSISGNAVVTQAPDRRIAISCSSKLDKIDIRKLFYATNNFGQDVIRDTNLMGELSGKLYFSSVWNSYLKLDESNLIADADIIIQNGQLMDYRPMLGLSRFINVEELKDIRFNTLKNQILIKNRKVIIPEMDIHSSAFKIKGSGIHFFDNHYDYRIQVELNQLLANKAKTRKKEIEEFGMVEDDGSGGLNIPLKIVGKANTYHVEFDRKKAINTFRSNINKEKEEIKNLLNPAKADDSIHYLPDEQNEKIIIEWDDGNEKKDFIFENKEQKNKEQPQFIIEWDEDNNTENKDTTGFK